MPERFGAYTLEGRLAAGGMAELVRAIEDDGASRVVLKRILPALKSDPLYAEMLHEEARIGAELVHPNVVRTLGAGAVHGEPFIVLEHVDGADLPGIVRRLAQRGAREVPLEQVLTLVLGVCAALAYVHERGIVHLDVSPPNVMASFAGEVKLVDFGLARRADAPADGRFARGRPSYMSPEQARGDSVDGRSDLFSLGIVLFELTTSKRLFVGQTEHETLQLVQHRDAPRPSSVRADYPPALETIVMRALARDRSARYPSAQAMHAELAAFAASVASAPPLASLAGFLGSLFDRAP